MNPITYVKSLRTERGKLITRLAAIDVQLADIREALADDLDAIFGAMPSRPDALSRLKKPPLPKKTPATVNNHKRTSLDREAIALRVFTALATREPAMKLSIEEDIDHPVGDVLRRLIAEGALVRRAWRTDGVMHKPPYYYARTEAALDAMERELIDTGQLADRPTKPSDAVDINTAGTTSDMGTTGSPSATADRLAISAS